MELESKTIVTEEHTVWIDAKGNERNSSGGDDLERQLREHGITGKLPGE
jgi:hypothetical protein